MGSAKVSLRQILSTKSDTAEVGSYNSTGFKQDPLFYLLLYFNSTHLKRTDLPLGQVILVHLCWKEQTGIFLEAFSSLPSPLKK